MKSDKFEKYLNNIEFDDKPDYNHRDKLEQKLLASLEKQKYDTKLRFNRNISKIAAAAVIIVGVLIGINSFTSTYAWGEVIKAFNNVQNVHVTQALTMQDGSVDKHEIWIKMPELLYEDSSSVTVIDNGTDRLIIDKENKTARFSDSFMPYKSVSEHFIFDEINIFRDDQQRNYEFKKLDDECTKTVLVFSLKFIGDLEELNFEGKAWVDAKSMLPLKIQAELRGEPKEGNPLSGEMICDYGPIPKSVFAMVIPGGFKELPRKQKSVISGKVLDENNIPVANAIVFATDMGGQFSEKTITDESGRFVYDLPPEGTGFAVLLPLMLRAYEVNVPDKVAWSIIKDPRTQYEPGGSIPYEVASVEIDNIILRSVNGIILRMEPAGTIAGKVTDINGNPIPNAQVKIVRCDLSDPYGNTGLTGINVLLWNGQEREFGIVKTDKNGTYELNNLPEFWKGTEFLIRTNSQGYSIGESTLHMQGSIEYEELNFHLYPYDSDLIISGVLKDNYGNFLEEREIYLRVNEQNYRFSRTKTDKQGRFTLIGSPVAEHIEVKAELSHNYMPPHEKEKYLSYVYYPDVIVDIGYQKNKNKYEVEMIAVKPELTIEVKVKDSTGRTLPDFPIAIRSDISNISWQWIIEGNFVQRTDKDGYCKFTNVPWLEGLKLVFSSLNATTSRDSLSGEERVKVAENYRKYKDTTIPIELIPGKKEYKVDATMLTKDESQL